MFCPWLRFRAIKAVHEFRPAVLRRSRRDFLFFDLGKPHRTFHPVLHAAPTLELRPQVMIIYARDRTANWKVRCNDTVSVAAISDGT